MAASSRPLRDRDPPWFDPTPIGGLVAWWAALTGADAGVPEARDLSISLTETAMARHVTLPRRFRLRNLCGAQHKFRYANLIVI